MNKEQFEETLLNLKESNEQAITFDGLDSAIIGIGGQYGKAPLAIYSASKIIKSLMKTNKWDAEEALEFYDFNIQCLYAGEGTPIIVDDI